jgi:molybdopterin-guanine dinucleotide biosynthesis protein A
LKTPEKINGIILAGGKSLRMGEDKGLLELKGLKMTEYVIGALEPTVSGIVIVSSNTEYNRFGYPVCADLIKDCGPAAGIYTGLHESTEEKNIVLSCDTPFVSTDFLRYLILHSGDEEITVPMVNSRVHPLIGIYRKAILLRLRRYLEGGERKMTTLIKRFETKYLDVSLQTEFDTEKIFLNINTPEELRKEREND